MSLDNTAIETAPNNPRYAATLGPIRTRTQIGGLRIPEDEFVAGVNNSIHPRGDTEAAFLDINHPDSPKSGRVDRFNNGVVYYRTGEYEHEFYVQNGNLKWDMIFNSAAEVPQSIVFKIKHSMNLSFYRQLLTRADIDEGCSYVVPEAHNSFAVYFNDRRDNQWQTGKVMHIYSPYYIDEAGAKSPFLDMELTGGFFDKSLTLSNTLAVIAWLAHPDRVGKIRLDPIIGYDTQGSNSASITGGNLWSTVMHTVASANGDVTALKAYTVTAGRSMTIAVYEANNSSPYNMFDAGGALYPLVSWGAGTTQGIGFTESFTPTNLKSISNGQTYRMAVNLSANTLVYYDTVAAFTREYKVFAYSTPPPDPSGIAAATDTVTRNFSIWAEYVESAAGGYYYQLLNNNRRGRS